MPSRSSREHRQLRMAGIRKKLITDAWKGFKGLPDQRGGQRKECDCNGEVQLVLEGKSSTRSSQMHFFSPCSLLP